VTDADHTTNNRTNTLQRESHASNAKSIITLQSSAEQLTKLLEVEEDSDCDRSVETTFSKQVCADLQVGPNKV